MKKKIRFTIRTKLLIMSMVTIAVAVATLGIFLSVSFADSAYQTASNTLESVSFNAAQGLESSVNSSESSMILLANQIGYNKEFANNITTSRDDMSDDEYNTLLEEFVIIQKQMELISEVPGLDDAEPMVFPFDVTTSFLREDIATEPLPREEALRNASGVVEGQIRLPKVVG